MKEIIFAPNGDNPSAFDLKEYSKEIINNQKSKRVISNDMALDIIRLAMKKGDILYSDYKFLIYDSENNLIYDCLFTKEFQWAEKDWQRSCTDLHKHCPTTNELDARLNILMELI